MLTMPVEGIYVKVQIQVASSPRQYGPRGCSPESPTKGCPRSLEGTAGVSISLCPLDGNPLAVLQPSEHRRVWELAISQSSHPGGCRVRSFTHFQQGAESCLFYPAKHW